MSTRAGPADGAFWNDVDDDVALDGYRTLVNTIDDGIFQLDSDDRFVATNDAFVETTGYDRTELLGEPVSLVLGATAVERVGRAASSRPESAIDRTDRRIDLDVLTADGTAVPSEVRINPVVDDGAVRGTIGVVREATTNRETAGTRESIDAPSDSIAAVLDEANIGVFVLDDEFDIAWADETVERYFGLDRGDLIGRPKREIVTETIAERTDDPERFAERVLATYDDNSAIERFDCRVTPGDDRRERWLEHHSKPIESGRYAGGRIEFYYDVTDRKRSEDALRESEEAFSSLVDAVEEYAIFRLDPDGRVATWNEGAREIKGYEPDEIIGEHFSAFYSERDRTEGVPERNLRAAIENGSVEDEGWRIRKDGSRFRAKATITALFDDDGTHRGYLKVTRDMTDRYERERELESELQRVFGRISDAFYAIDEEFRFTHVNERAEELLRTPEEELLGEELYEVFPSAAEIDEVRDAFQTALNEQESTSYEVYYDDLDFWVEAKLYPSESGISVYFRDVTDRKERERELEETERLYRTLVEHFPNGAVALVDEDLRYVTFGGTPVDDSDTTRTDLEGTSVRDRSPELREFVAPRYEAALDGETSSLERTIDGDVYQFQFVPVRDDRDEVFAAIGMAQDVTERKQRERELARYETIVETVNDGIYAVDGEGRFTMVNDAYTDLTGYSREELLGSHVSLVADDETVERAKALEAALAADEPDQPVIETRLRTASGDRVPTEATFAMLPSDEGERVGVARNITDRKERERALEESERRYRTLVEYFPNGAVGLYDEDLTYTVAGGEMMNELGIMPEEVVGSTLDDRHPEDLVDEIKPHFRAVFDGESSTFELEYYDRYLLAQTLPVRNAADEIYAGMVMIQDVTERREYQRKLEESNERLEQFAYVASHDLQEPLRMVTSYLQLLERRYGDELDADAEEFLEFAVDGAERMRSMIDGLLEYSRVETRGEPFEPVDLDALLDAVREDLQLQIAENDARIAAEELPQVDGDPSQLRQLFQNLLSNAIEYSGDEPPRIEVFAERDGDRWTVSVRDDGIGIHPDETDRIFDVFARLHTQEEHAGTGIGLALCRRIVERHGGEIRVDSEPGEGSTFTVTLPAADDEA